MLVAFSLRKGKAKAGNRAARASPVPRAEGHQQNMNHPPLGAFAPHSGHTEPFARPVRL